MSAVALLAPGSPPPRWSVEVPGSKSITNRAVLLAGVAEGRSRLSHVLVSDDTVAMREALRALGASVSGDGADLFIGGLAGPPMNQASLYCGMAGTVGRFLLPMVAAGWGRFTLDAHPQLRRRPLGPVLEALRAQGAQTDADSFPLEVRAMGLSGGVVEVDASVSSQFLSGLMLAAPFARRRTVLCFDLDVSRPYVVMTAAVMRAFGATVELSEHAVVIEPGPYRAVDYQIEPDASTASYFLAAAALTGTTVTLPGLSRARTGQGDIALADHLVAMGAVMTDAPAGLSLTGPPHGRLAGVHVEMSQASDVFMTLACVAPFADSVTTIEGLSNVRVKESDRLAATASNLTRLGVRVEEGADYLRVHPVEPGALGSGVLLPTYDDHRIAMAFSLIATAVPLSLEHPRVVDKTCPTFWDLWPSTGAQVALLLGVDEPAGTDRTEAA